MGRSGKMKPPASLYVPARSHAPARSYPNVVESPAPQRPKHRVATPPTVQKPRKTKEPPASTSPDLERGDPPPRLLVILLGLSGESLRTRCATIARLVRQRAAEPLFVVDDDTSLAHLRRRSLMFEFVPPRAARALVSPSLQWNLYDRRRANLLHEKWQPAGVMAVGRAAREFAALMPPTPDPPNRSRMVRILRRLRSPLQ